TNLNVRSRASSKRNSKILCTQLTGALGTIKKGPNNSWWNIDYDVRCDGWSLQAYLSLVTTTAATVTAPISRTLSVGSQGEEVTKLQTILSKLGYYKVGITGYFGTLTKAAVMKFQTANALDAVGQVGPRTRKVLQEIVW
ncbi:MAG: peptidoglycan-binding domain-containing protein, partial [Candidatus Liptonbacteria bacterium]|nr:peptidoglycan-binding domain-containing protein [Candidatus Liptonbacteria bacterium]